MDTSARVSNRRVMDIEDVLIWAYRDELPKRRIETGGFGEPCSISPMFRGAVHGGRIDNWSREPGMPATLGDPHPDALVVETAVQGLAKLRDRPPSDVDPAWLCSDFAGLGVDQEAALTRAQRAVDLLVVVNARLRRRPPFELTPQPRATFLTNGKPAIVAPDLKAETTISGTTIRNEVLAPTVAIRAGVYRPGARCPIAYSPSPEAVLLERAEYAIWQAALAYLAEELAGALATISVLPPSAPARPWLGEADLGKPVTIREDLRAPVHRARRPATPRRTPAPPRRRPLPDRGAHLPRAGSPAPAIKSAHRETAI